MDYLIDPSFQGINRLFVLLFENENDREAHTRYYLPKVEIKDCNVMVDGRNFFDQPCQGKIMWKHMKTFEISQGDDYTIGCLLDYNYFKEHYKLIAIDLSKQQAFDADLKAMQQINFTGNLEQAEGETMFFIIEEAKETILNFSQGTMTVV